MVVRNMGIPEPPDNDSIISNNNIIMPVESDTDEEDNVYEGYERLPLGAEDAVISDPEDSEEEDFIEETDSNEPTCSIPKITPIEQTLMKEVWSESTNNDIEMDGEKVNQVKEAMINFSLPASNIPEWANKIPEECWKEHILQKIQNKS